MSSPRTPTSLTHRRVIIVGAGQTGLAVAAALISEGLTPQKDFVVVDRGTGERTWASRWHSLQLLSDARHSALPSHPLPGDQRRHPRGDEIAEYLDDLQTRLGVIPALGVEATGVRIIPAVASASSERVTLVDGTQLQPQSVILATGYLPGDDWLPAHARDTRSPRTQTPIPGLFVSGIPRYSSRGADTLAGVWRDATTIAHHITTRP